MVNIRKIADIGNVSTATVSRVFNNSPFVKEETRRKVQKLIRKHGYSPNPLAQGLIQKKTWLVGIIVPDMYNQFIPTVVEPLTQILANAKYQCILNLTENDHNKEERAIKEILRFYCEALLFVGTRIQKDPNRNLIERIGEKIPIIMINALDKYKNTFQVYNDEYEAIKNVVEYIVNHDRKRLALVIGPSDQNTFINKKKGFVAGLAKRNIDVDHCSILEGYTDYESGYKAADILIGEKVTPDAIIAGSDIIALGILKFLMDKRIRVPEDIMLTGYDNIPSSGFSTPGLTTVDQMGGYLGKNAAEVLLKIFKGEKKITDICYVPKLCIRDTA